MTTIVQSPADQRIEITQGDDFSVQFAVTENGVVYDWTGATVVTGITTSYGAPGAVNWTVLTAAGGLLTLSLSEIDTAALGTTTWQYFVTVTKAGITRTWVAGALVVAPPFVGKTSVAPSGSLSITTSPTVTLALNLDGLTLAQVASKFTSQQEAFQDFRTAADGSLTTLDTGQTWNPVWDHTNPTWEPKITSGAMGITTTGATPSAGYANVQLAGNVRRIGADVTFSSYTSNNGAAGLIVWQTALPFAAGPIPYAPLHLVVAPTSWILSVWDAGGGVLVTLQSGTFSVPLVADGVTLNRIQAELDGTTCRVFLPDGTVVTSVDARHASYAGPYACFEPYKANSNTDSNAKFIQVWASSGKRIADERPATLPEVAAQIRAATGAAIYVPGTAGNNITFPAVAATQLAGSFEVLIRASLHDLTTTLGLLGTGAYAANGDMAVVTGAGFLIFYDFVKSNAGVFITVPYAIDVDKWIKIAVDTVAGTVTFSHAPGSAVTPTAWTQISTPQTITTGTRTAKSFIEFGSYAGNAAPTSGKLSRLIIRSGLGLTATEIVDYRADISRGNRWRDSHANVFTVNGSAWSVTAG